MQNFGKILDYCQNFASLKRKNLEMRYDTNARNYRNLPVIDYPQSDD